MPISQDQLAALFDHLDEALSAGCDRSLKLTRAFLTVHALDVDAIIPWLGQYGGYCDCEVLSNVEEVWGQYMVLTNSLHRLESGKPTQPLASNQVPNGYFISLFENAYDENPTPHAVYGIDDTSISLGGQYK